jgi:hypothetical protein
MAVCPSERRTRIGREVLQRLIRYGKRKALTIRVNAGSIETHQFPRSQGFTVIAIEMKSPQRKYIFQKVMDCPTTSTKNVTQEKGVFMMPSPENNITAILDRIHYHIGTVLKQHHIRLQEVDDLQQDIIVALFIRVKDFNPQLAA